jgi:hypothetical protein
VHVKCSRRDSGRPRNAGRGKSEAIQPNEVGGEGAPVFFAVGALHATHINNCPVPAFEPTALWSFLPSTRSIPHPHHLPAASVSSRDLQVCLRRRVSTNLHQQRRPVWQTLLDARGTSWSVKSSYRSSMPSRHLRVLIVLALIVREVEASFGLHPDGQVGDPMYVGPSHLPAERILVQRLAVSTSL